MGVEIILDESFFFFSSSLSLFFSLSLFLFLFSPTLFDNDGLNFLTTSTRRDASLSIMIEDEPGTIDLRKEILVELIMDFNCHPLLDEQSILENLQEMPRRTKTDGPNLFTSKVIGIRKQSSMMFSFIDRPEENFQ
jgi:hypothetical protein